MEHPPWPPLQCPKCNGTSWTLYPLRPGPAIVVFCADDDCDAFAFLGDPDAVAAWRETLEENMGITPMVDMQFKPEETD